MSAVDSDLGMGELRPPIPVLPPEIIVDILSLLPQAMLARCLRANSDMYALALPLLYRRIAIPSLTPTVPHDVRDPSSPPRVPLRGPDPREFASSFSRLPPRLQQPHLRPASLIRELTVPHHPLRETCRSIRLKLSTLHLYLDVNCQTHTGVPPGAVDVVQALLHRGQARVAQQSLACDVLCNLTADHVVLHGGGLLFSRMYGSLIPLTVAPKHITILAPPSRGVAGSAAKFEYPWAGAPGLLGFLASFPNVPTTFVFDADKWKPIPKPKDGAVGGVPLWLVRFLRGVAGGIGSRQLSIVNVESALEDVTALPGLLREVGELAQLNGGCEPTFLTMEEWRTSGHSCSA